MEGVFQSPTYFVAFGLLRQRDLFADCPTQFRILLMEVSVVRVSKASGDLMNRGRPVRTGATAPRSPSTGQLRKSWLLPASSTNGFGRTADVWQRSCGRVFGRLDRAYRYLCSPDFAPPPTSCADTDSSRAARRACRSSLALRYGDTPRLPVRAKASFAATMCAGVGPDGANRLEAGTFRNRQVRSRFSSRGTRAPSNQLWRMLCEHRICCAKARTFPPVT